LGQALEVLAQALGASGPLHQVLLLRSEEVREALEQALGALEQVLGALDQARGGALGLAALGPLPSVLLRLLASVPQQQVPLHLAPRTLSEPAVVALEVRDLLDLLLAEALEQVVDSAVLPLHLGKKRPWALEPVPHLGLLERLEVAAQRLLAEALEQVVDSAVLPLHLGPRPLGVALPRVEHPSLRRWGLRLALELPSVSAVCTYTCIYT
jgi:hypothetical protein